jgi:glycerate 2-kinase
MNCRKTLVEIFQKALASVQPRTLMRKAIRVENGKLWIGGRRYRLRDDGGVYVFGSGKASVGMAREVSRMLRGYLAGGLVVSNDRNASLKDVDVFVSSHPVPTEKSIRAAEIVRHRLSRLSEKDFFIYLLSGGSSALLEKPVPPIQLIDMQKVTEMLLHRAVPIGEINVVRKHLSTVKGGRLGRLSPARGVVLVISDVIGDDLEAIGSAPLYRDRSSFSDACDVLKKYDLWPRLPATVKKVLAKGLKGKIEDTPENENPKIDHRIIGSNLQLLEEAQRIAVSFGIRSRIMTSSLRGEAREVALAIVAIGEEMIKSGRPFKGPSALIFGGETTVHVKGKGRGGRNQEMCLAALREIGPRMGMTFLSAGSDGVDGSSDAAGAVVDSTSYEKAKHLKLLIDDYLNNNDSHSFFKQTGDLIYTGPTGTNVMDISILYVQDGK